MSLTRIRLAVLAAVFVVLGASAGGNFDRFVWVLVIAPVVPIGLVALTVARRRAEDDEHGGQHRQANAAQ